MSSVDSTSPMDATLAPTPKNADESPVASVLKALASLKFTVILFVLSMVLVFLGTLAQVEQDMWEVLDRYFKSWVAIVDVKVLFPPSFFPYFVRSSVYDSIATHRFPIPGGATLGVCLTLNLIAAHLVRFKIQAKGDRLVVGSVLMAVGVLVATLVVLSGNFQDGLQTEPIISYGVLWKFYLAALVALWGAMLYRYVTNSSERWIEQRLLLVGSLGMTALLAVLLLYYKKMQLPDEYMRILWQLTQGLGAGVLMLAGAIMVFRRRAGIVVLHAGVGIMMIGVVVAALYSVEERVTLFEGETTNYTYDIRTAELAVVDSSDERHDDVTVVPVGMLEEATEEAISHGGLPFDVKLVEFFPNAILKPIGQMEDDFEAVATTGVGTQWAAVGQRKASGADADSAVDLPAAYVQFIDKQTQKPIDTHLLSIIQASADEPEHVKVGERSYEVYLRFKRTYRPFSLTLLDVKKEDYVGTSTPRNYSSDIRLVDATRGEDRKVHIWMNNPLRFANLTFYQSGYDNVDGREKTDLQVVRNLGWMIPYVACSIVGVGMFWHFGLMLVRFLNGLPPGTGGGHWGSRLAAAVVVLLIVYGAMASSRRLLQKDGFDMQAAARIPVMHEGRMKPLGTLSRTVMRAMSKRSSFKTEDGKKLPAIRWLFDIAAADPVFHDGEAPESPVFKTHPVFRIDNLDVLDTLGLERRSRFRYALAEFEDRLAPENANGEPSEFAKALAEAKKLEGDKPEQLSTYQRKLIETEKRLSAYKAMEVAFSASSVPMPNKNELNTMAGRQKLAGTVNAIELLKRFEPPLAVPTDLAALEMGETWQPYPSARALAEIQSLIAQEPDSATVAWNNMLQSYANNDPDEFNKNVEGYLAMLADHPPEGYNPRRINAEAMLNAYAPFTICMVFYVFAFVVQTFAWLFTNNARIRTGATSLLVGCLIVHTLAIVARLYISGRPAPVTTLYSSAVFIGWAVAFAGVFLEVITRLGVGNVLSSMSGFLALLVASGLANKGDTFTVLQAVLDTDFWLTTHVVCITLGYAATFGAGLLGVLYVLGAVTRFLDNPQIARTLTRMTYGMLCFAIFFSFIGTVLGGLWADDSWGRFWGWDPKETAPC